MSPEIEALRTEWHAKPHPCYDGQWTVHEPHPITLRVQAWLGGGEETVQCPGVKTGETLPERHARDGYRRPVVAQSTARTVAQAVSFAVDEVQEFGTSDGDSATGLPLQGPDGNPSEDLRVIEVSAELLNGEPGGPFGEFSSFTVKTSDGREWTVSITPKA